jgi:hypothetical protein
MWRSGRVRKRKCQMPRSRLKYTTIIKDRFVIVFKFIATVKTYPVGCQNWCRNSHRRSLGRGRRRGVAPGQAFQVASTPRYYEAAAQSKGRRSESRPLVIEPAVDFLPHIDLPSGITIMKIYVDFMRHLLKHTKQFFEMHVLQGKEEWRRYFPSMEIVIAHPNGWGLYEQDFLRRAAVAAGYATSQNAISQIKFVSEAEASVHFCLFQLDLHSTMNVSF